MAAKLSDLATGFRSEISCPALNHFGETLPRVETRVYLHHISNYSSDVLAPSWVHAPGSCLADPPFNPDLATVLPNYS
jgi:hypothetical protein